MSDPHRTTRDDDLKIAALRRGEDHEIAGLLSMVRRRLAMALRDVPDSDLDDFAQDACVRILAKLDTFRGESRFETWAMAIAVRVAFSAMRRASWTAARASASLDQLSGETVEWAEPSASSEHSEALRALTAAINQDLTARQREVILAELQGVPLAAIAEAMGSSRNAIYKMAHDARQKLRASLEASGFGKDDVRPSGTTASKEAV